MTGEDALPLHREDRERAIQIVGSTTRRFAKAVGLYLIFALPSLVMGITYIALEFGDLLSLDSHHGNLLTHYYTYKTTSQEFSSMLFPIDVYTVGIYLM